MVESEEVETHLVSECGRCRSEMVVPREEFKFADLCIFNCPICEAEIKEDVSNYPLTQICIRIS